jgi:hypothetical protein
MESIEVVGEAIPLPVHPFEVRINIGGEDWEYVMRAMQELRDHMERLGSSASMMSGGAGGSHSVTVSTRDVTPEQFRKELEEWRRKTIELKK